jgi:HTH-type transcriptional regulator/antitoxin HigA
MLKPIRNKKDYDQALAEAYSLMQLDLKPRSQDADELEVLTMLIERYEADHFAIAPPDPIEAIKFRMEQLGLKSAELGRILGYPSRASEIMRGKRKLTLEMVRNLHEQLNIPLESLIGRSKA